MPKGNGKPIAKVKFDSELTEKEAKILLNTLQTRFYDNMNRHKDVNWTKVLQKLKDDGQKLESLYAMEQTGGEPDVVGYDAETDEYHFVDCSEQSPNRRNICYDREGEKQREKKGVFPAGNALDIAKSMKIEILNEKQYRNLQRTGEFDTKTSSWIRTPKAIRGLGGALFSDRRYNSIFVYHNSAKSFYSDRGFRGLLKV